MTSHNFLFRSAALWALVCCAAHAQESRALMPPGSHDLALGAMFVNAPEGEGSSKRESALLPALSGSWSNGIFASLGRVGMSLSDDPVVNYGPLLAYGIRQQRADDDSDSASLEFRGGGFASYAFASNLNFSLDALYGGGANHHGLELDLNAAYAEPIAAHHTLVVTPQLVWANAAYMQSTFGLTPGQALTDHLSTYRAGAGAKDVGVDVRWDWELGTRVTLLTGMLASRLVGSAADSPLVERRNQVYGYSSLTWRF